MMELLYSIKRRKGENILVLASHMCFLARLEDYMLLDEAFWRGKEPARRTFTKKHKTLAAFLAR